MLYFMKKGYSTNSIQYLSYVSIISHYISEKLKTEVDLMKCDTLHYITLHYITFNWKHLH